MRKEVSQGMFSKALGQAQGWMWAWREVLRLRFERVSPSPCFLWDRMLTL